MFAASKDMMGKDHIVECNPSITTVNEAIKTNNPKYLWVIRQAGNQYILENKKYGRMFSAAEDKKDNDHIVETRPGSGDTTDKWLWNMQATTVAWMTKLADSKLLSELSIPGTHESCALHDFPGTTYNAKCQNLDLESQLTYGVRVLDLRLKKTSANTLEAWHGDTPVFNVDQQISFDRIVEICQTFLSRFNGETIIVSIKKEGGDDISGLVEQEINSNSQLWYTQNAIPLLKDVRGKIVLLRRFDGNSLGIDLSPGKWKDNNPDFTIQVPNGTFSIQDEYHPSGNKEAAKAGKWAVVKNMLDLCNASNAQNCWYLNFTSGYYMVDYGVSEIPDIAVISNAVNKQLKSYLPGLNKCGTLMVDFIDDTIIQEIISLNK
ncbi:MAG: phosphatidylinositol-specific phospholipase C [Thioploca sp.]|nr:phosphatidylinositol-specific phospholipase C [Thioploca sp.]